MFPKWRTDGASIRPPLAELSAENRRDRHEVNQAVRQYRKLQVNRIGRRSTDGLTKKGFKKVPFFLEPSPGR